MSKNVFNEMTSEKKEEKRNKRRESTYRKPTRDIPKRLYASWEEEKKYTRCYI